MRYSELSDYYKCPKFYELRYVLKVASDQLPSASLLFGTAMHAALEEYLRGGDGTVTFQAFWEAERGKPITYYNGETWEGLLDDGQVLLARFQRLHLKHLEPQFLEVKLDGSYQGQPLSGTCDMAGKYKGVDSVIDFKTSAKPYEKDKIRTSEQMYIYNHMLMEAHNFNARQHVYMVFKKSYLSAVPSIQVITREVPVSELISVMANVGAVAEEITKRSLFTKNKNSCMMGKYKCEMWSHCYKRDGEVE